MSCRRSTQGFQRETRRSLRVGKRDRLWPMLHDGPSRSSISLVVIGGDGSVIQVINALLRIQAEETRSE